MMAGCRKSGRGKAYPLGATYDGSGTNFAVFSEAAEKVELCLFGRGRTLESQGDAARGRRLRLARLHPQHRARPALRLPGVRPVRSCGGAALQPEQAADRPVREGDRRHLRVEPVAVRLQLRRSRQPQRRRLGGQHAQVGGDQPVLRLGRGSPARARIRRHRHLRGARQGAHPDAPGHPGEHSRDVCRRRTPGDHRAPEVVGRQRDRVDADASLRRRLDVDRQGADQLLGLQHHRLLRAGGRSTAAVPPRAGRCRSSRPWSAPCTRPTSR